MLRKGRHLEVFVYMKKIFAILMVVSVLGAFLAGCSKPAEETGGAATAATTADTKGTTEEGK